MSSTKAPHWQPEAAPRPLSEAARRAAAAILRRASALLARWARRVAVPATRARPLEPHLEFYAEAGAPEGAVYLDGQLVGWLPGVQRL